VLELAASLTNHPAYYAALNAMHLHRLDRGGLRHAFKNLQKRHGHDDSPSDHSYAPQIGELVGLDLHAIDENVYKHDDGRKCTLLQAIEYVVAIFGVNGDTFESAVKRIQKAYNERDDRQQYLNELIGFKTR
jgi:hypothetical protein